MLVDADGHEAHHVFVERQLPLDLVIAAGGASMLISVKWALRFFLIRKASDFRPQDSTLETAPPLRGDDRLDRFGQRFDLRRGHVLTRQIDMLVESH